MNDGAESLPSSRPSEPPRTFGRYVLHAPIARGGMATIYIARLVGAEGFSRLVAAKRLHPPFTDDPEFVTMFHDEAKVASKIHHPNVVPVLDVVLSGDEVVLIQEYVHGVPLDRIVRRAFERDEPIPVAIGVAIVAGILAGLHAAHDARDEFDEPLRIVHRDVSPHNVIVSLDGIARVLDFGIAKARSTMHVTREGVFKGKLSYIAPEQLRGEMATAASDVYSAAVVAWEILAHRRLRSRSTEGEVIASILQGHVPSLGPALDERGARPSLAERRTIAALEPIVLRALSPRPNDRFASAAIMLEALVAACPPASPYEVAQWVRAAGAEFLEQRQALLAATEGSWRSQSKIAVAAAFQSSGPESAIVSVRRAPDDPLAGRPVAGGPAPSPIAAPAAHSKPRLVPFAIAGAALVAIGFVAALATRSEPVPVAIEAPREAPAAPVVAVAAPGAPSAAMTVSPPEPPRAAERSAAPPSSSPATPLRIFHPVPPTPAPRAPILTKASPSAPAPSSARPASSDAAPAPSSPQSSSLKADCDPPFYFEGSKKLYKANCL